MYGVYKTETTSPAAHEREMRRYVPATGAVDHGAPLTVTTFVRFAQNGTRMANVNVGDRPASGVTVMTVVAVGSSGKPDACATWTPCDSQFNVDATNRFKKRVEWSGDSK